MDGLDRAWLSVLIFVLAVGAFGVYLAYKQKQS